MSFYISPSVSPPSSDLEKIVEAAGGQILKQRPNTQIFTENKDENVSISPQAGSFHFCITFEGSYYGCQKKQPLYKPKIYCFADLLIKGFEDKLLFHIGVMK